MPDNAVVANRATVAIFHYHVAIATWNCTSAKLHSEFSYTLSNSKLTKMRLNHNFDFLSERFFIGQGTTNTIEDRVDTLLKTWSDTNDKLEPYEWYLKSGVIGEVCLK